ATDIDIELLRGTTKVGSGTHHIGVDVTTFDDARYIKITRRVTGATTAKRYSVEVNYPSQLPILERRIPLGFFRKGFEENWNQHPYLSFRLDGEYFTINFDQQFAQLYGLENPTKIKLYDVFQDINSTSIRFGAGAGPNPLAPLQSGESPYFSLSVTCEAGGADEIDLPDPLTTINLPNIINMEFRFYLVAIGGQLEYMAKVSSPLINALPTSVSIAGYDVEVRPRVIREIESGLNKLQRGGATTSRFGGFLGPWLIGERREVASISYDRSRDQIVVQYVGPLPPPSEDLVLSDGADRGGAPLPPELIAAPRMFDTPMEIRLPPRGVSGDPLSRQRWYAADAGEMPSKFDHVVVLMMENRSFDQVLGYLSRDQGRTDVDGLPPPGSPAAIPVFNDYGGRRYEPRRITDTSWFGYNVAGPGHEHEHVVSQIADNMAHFVSNFAKRMGDVPERLQRIMDYYGPDALPAYAAMASQFGICDRWFCSHVGPTWPNRFITFSGDLNRDGEGEPELNQPHLSRMTPIETTTFFDHLSDRNVSWRCFEHGYSFIRLYTKYTFDMDKVVGFNDPARGFLAAARSGTLPAVSFIEPDYVDLPPGNDDHPPADMADGQRLVATVAKALLESPQWERTLFIVTYDEHGGFYDHVVPPETHPLMGSPLFRQLGPRVPALVMSPYVPAGSVSHQIYDHTTIAATILRRFCAPRLPKLSLRADNANDLRSMLTLQTPRRAAEFARTIQRLNVITAVARRERMRARKIAVSGERDDFHGALYFSRMITGSAP
ncbi:MAG: hypothetical protein E6Q88_10405, partial [Lysobacteraceae bacterium]